MTNESKCVLSARCKKAATPACNNECGAWIALYGLDGKGGRVGAAGLPADYRHVTLKNSPARGEQAAIYERLDKYVATFSRQFEDEMQAKINEALGWGTSESDARRQWRIKSAYLHSDAPGTGKTTTAAGLMSAWIAENYVGSLKRGMQPDQRPAYFLSVNDLQQTHNKTHLPANQQTKERLGEELMRKIELAKRTPFVIMDDLAVRKATSSFAGILYDICDYRTTENLVTIYTSNKSPDDLKIFFREEDPEGKIVDRIVDRAAVIPFSGTSKRGRR